VKKLLLFLKKFGLILNIFAATALLIAYLTPYVSPDIFWPLSFFGLLYPFILLLNICFLVFWLLQKSKYFLLSTLIILLGISHITHFVQFKSSKKETGQGIRVLSYNVNYFSYNRKNKSNAQKLIQYLSNSSADIICLQEAALSKSGKSKGLQQELKDMKHYQFAHSVSFGGPVTFSRFPIINYGEIRFANTFNMIIFSDIKINEN
jgi:glucan phosphoethanolaminetransferase (alkaline phosphatase superfamily)